MSDWFVRNVDALAVLLFALLFGALIYTGVQATREQNDLDRQLAACDRRGGVMASTYTGALSGGYLRLRQTPGGSQVKLDVRDNLATIMARLAALKPRQTAVDVPQARVRRALGRKRRFDDRVSPVRGNRLSHQVMIYRGIDVSKLKDEERQRAAYPPKPIGRQFTYRTGQRMALFSDGSIRRVVGSGRKMKRAAAWLRQIMARRRSRAATA